MDTIFEKHQMHNLPIGPMCQALSLSRATYYRYVNGKDNPNHPAPHDSSTTPSNAMTSEEKQHVLNLLHTERFVDQTPYQVYYSLLDEGAYYCSIRSMYRLLTEQGETVDRRAQRQHRDAVKPELIACVPNEVWSWDITKLLSLQRLVYYYLYVILDIYSRFVVGWLIADRECQKLAHDLIQTTALRQGIQPGQLTLHADNGPSMTSGTVAQLLEHMGVVKSHNRPYTSNDNPFSESQFKTLKYCSAFPSRFASLAEAEQFCQQFFQWYNHQHYHSGIAYLTPYSVHNGQADKILAKRHETLIQAYHNRPERFGMKVPERKVIKPAYINPPNTVRIDLQEAKVMV